MLTHAQARRIASEWHTGQNDPLYAFVSTGRITDNTVDVVDGLLHDPNEGQDRIDLRALKTYLRIHNGQAAYHAWHALWSDAPAELIDC